MKQWAWLSLLLVCGCRVGGGDAIADGNYRGNPLYVVHGKVGDTFANLQPETDYNMRLYMAMRWANRDGAELILDEAPLSPGGYNLDQPIAFEIHHLPPPEVMETFVDAQGNVSGRVAFGYPFAFNDGNRDGKFDPTERDPTWLRDVELGYAPLYTLVYSDEPPSVDSRWLSHGVAQNIGITDFIADYKIDQWGCSPGSALCGDPIFAFKEYNSSCDSPARTQSQTGLVLISVQTDACPAIRARGTDMCKSGVAYGQPVSYVGDVPYGLCTSSADCPALCCTCPNGTTDGLSGLCVRGECADMATACAAAMTKSPKKFAAACGAP
jgi:hypothetical protein